MDHHPALLPVAFLALSHAALSIVTGPAAAQDGPRNLLENPSFSSGVLSPTGWELNLPTGATATWVQQVGLDSPPCAIELVGAGQDWAGLTSQAVLVEPGQQLTVAAWMQALPDRQPTDVDCAYVRFFGATGFKGQEGPGLGSVTAEWTLVSGVVTVPEGVQQADFSLQIRSNGGVRAALAGLFLSAIPAAGLLPDPPAGGEWRPIPLPRLGEAADHNGNGLADSLERFLSITDPDRAVSRRKTRRNATSFQTPTGYREDNDLKVDTVIVAGNSEASIRSWGMMGYTPHVMGGFRAGPDYVEAQGHQDEVQTTAAGTLLTCGPGSYYMVPTANRRAINRQYYMDAAARGAQAVCPEEPEFFASAGYSEAFKREWQAEYGEPWRDPASSVQARWMAERLKAKLEVRLMLDCYEGGRSANPNVERFMLAHSPANYTAWGITFGHHELLATGAVDSMVAQVWTGTAQSACPYEGASATRTFENAFLEYASSIGLTRGTDVDLWFLMDPVEDNPDRTMEAYHENYERTLGAALMFPEVFRFETMPWPTRIFGRVPDIYATEICSVINVLSEMQDAETASLDAGPTGIGTFLGDSAMWQRAAPAPSDMASFYGVALPLLMKGLPVEVPCLDRAADPGYLDAYRVLFVSYDMLKPTRPEVNAALADWVRSGGVLIALGGEDAYNAVDEWWHGEGFASPQDHLLSLCGFATDARQVTDGRGAAWNVVARSDYAGRTLENRGIVEVDLSPYLSEGAVLVRCGDSLPDDGWGALISRVEATGVRNGQPVSIDAYAATDAERALIAEDRQTGVTGPQAGAPADAGARFCDVGNYVVYRLEFDAGTKATLRLDIGNQYVISVAPASALTPQRAEPAEAFAPFSEAWEIARDVPLVLYDDPGATPLLTGADGAVAQERALGRGTVIQVALPPAWFARSPHAAQAMRSLAHYALEAKLGVPWQEQQYLKVSRGRYVIAKTLGESLSLEGPYLNVLEADLPIVDRVDLGPDQVAVLLDPELGRRDAPGLIFSSSCVEWTDEAPSQTRLIASGAKGVTGTMRLYSAGRVPQEVVARAANGRDVAVEIVPQGDTVLLRYPNEPLGLGIRVGWTDR